MDTLGEKLKKLRKSKKWTLEEVARKLGLRGHSTYSNWEYDRREPDLDTITKLAEIYGVDPGYLMPNRNLQDDDGFADQLTEYVDMAKSHPDIELAYEQTKIIRKNYENDKIYRLIKESKETNDQLSKIIKIKYKDSVLNEEKAKQVIAFIRFLAESE